MGGMHGYIRGKTKLETWLKFKKMFLRDPEPHGLHLDTPVGKKDAFRNMEWDEKTKEWVLFYHFGK